MRNLSRVLTCIVAGAIVGIASAQPAPDAFKAGVPTFLDAKGNPTNKGYATLHFNTKIGSFKLLEGEGKVQFSFRGSVMLNVLKNTKVSFSGDVKRQYEGRGREVYFGTGTCTIIGRWNSVQFFGRNLSGMWWGTGRIRLVSEFFKDEATGELVTGQFWYNDPKDKNFWFNGGVHEISLPERKQVNADVQVKERKG